MEFPGADVHDVRGFRRFGGRFFRLFRFFHPALPGPVINPNAGLYVIDEHIEANGVILNGCGFQMDSGGYEIFSLKNRRGPVEDMISGFFQLIPDNGFKGVHAHRIHVPRAGYQIPLIGVFPGQAETY